MTRPPFIMLKHVQILFLRITGDQDPTAPARALKIHALFIHGSSGCYHNTLHSPPCCVDRFVCLQGNEERMTSKPRLMRRVLAAAVIAGVLTTPAAHAYDCGAAMENTLRDSSPGLFGFRR